MKPILVIGIVLLAVGIAMLAYQGISYTRREQVAQVGPLRVTTEERKTLPLPPVAGAAAVGIGTALVDARAVEDGDWAGLEARARRLAEAVRGR